MCPQPVGGVHGLERIGAEVVIAYLQSLVTRMRWDSTLHRQLESVRLVFMPLVNPGGMLRGTRANPAGVDLNCNAPVDADDRVPWLVGGQRASPNLPWYRGAAGNPDAARGAGAVRVGMDELLSRPFSIAIDCHLGFGTRDRLWFPYAHTRAPVRHLAEMHALQDIFWPRAPAAPLHHRTAEQPVPGAWRPLGFFAPGSRQARRRRPCLPAAHAGDGLLALGQENPRQLFSRHGIFNPLIQHRQERVSCAPMSPCSTRWPCGHRLAAVVT